MTHALNHGKAKDVFHNLDLIAIYLVIAGTYTPIALSILRGSGGWIMFGIEWGLALAGLLIKIFSPSGFNKSANAFAIISYVIMGWLLLFFLKPLFANMSLASTILIFGGGFSIALGFCFSSSKK